MSTATFPTYLLNRLMVIGFCFIPWISQIQAQQVEKNPEKPFNILFIAVDDLRPQLNCYGKSKMVSPNIDRLASEGVLFERAFCMVPTCGASRASLMTSIRPTRTRFTTYLTYAEKDAPGIVPLNTYFKQNGYTTVSLGKVYHHKDDHAEGWSEPAWRPRTQAYKLEENMKIVRSQAGKGKKARGPSYESADAPDEEYPDGLLAQQAMEQLSQLSKNEEPFFLAVGFIKPHLPFVCPQRDWDLYSEEEIQLPPNFARPEDVPQEALHNSGELRAYSDIPAKGPIPEETCRKLIHGYYACVSFTDRQIGKVLQKLEDLNLKENTIVVLWGDHGWNLGEHNLWCKHCCFETSMHIPLIVRVPGLSEGQGSYALIETVDIYPTLCDLAGIALPTHVQGKSFLPILQDPTLAGKETAIGRFRDGDTVRTDKFRYSEYTDKKGKLLGKMLFNHKQDPEEDQNLAEQKKNQEKVSELSNYLKESKKINP
ncbi:Iduronate sulfatase [Planctomycetales bacterium 10988]|nr:Iduronate sulfatase [Planctomycetales bacterium 10988]